jgi:hypothetical protein
MNACASATVGAVLACLASESPEDGDNGFLAAVCARAVQNASRTRTAVLTIAELGIADLIRCEDIAASGG